MDESQGQIWCFEVRVDCHKVSRQWLWTIPLFQWFFTINVYLQTASSLQLNLDHYILSTYLKIRILTFKNLVVVRRKQQCNKCLGHRIVWQVNKCKWGSRICKGLVGNEKPLQLTTSYLLNLHSLANNVLAAVILSR